MDSGWRGRRCLAQGLIQSVAASPSAFIGLFVINVSRALKLFWSAEFGVVLSGLFWVVVYFEAVVFQKCPSSPVVSPHSWSPDMRSPLYFLRFLKASARPFLGELTGLGIWERKKLDQTRSSFTGIMQKEKSLPLRSSNTESHKFTHYSEVYWLHGVLQAADKTETQSVTHPVAAAYLPCWLRLPLSGQRIEDDTLERFLKLDT